VGDVSAWKGRDQVPQLECYLVENHDRRLSKITFVEKSSVSFPFQANWERLTVGEIERKVVWGGGTLATDLFQDLPTLNLVYEMLKRDLAHQYGLA
jgi:hypothetical protein